MKLHWFTLFALPTCLMATNFVKFNDMIADPSRTIAYVIEDAQTGTRIAEQNPSTVYTLASVQKILPALVAGRILGPDYRYETALYENANTGELHLVFNADADLTQDQLKTLLKAISTGTRYKALICHDCSFSKCDWCPSWMFEDAPSSFANCVTAALIDRNKTTVRIHPTKPGAAPTVELSVPYALKNYALTVASDPKMPLELFWENGELTLTGEIQTGAPLKQKHIYAHSAADHVTLIVKDLLTSLGQSIEVHYIRSPNPPTSELKLLATHQSAPLKETLPPACQASNNIYFDTLFLHLGSLEAQFQPHMSQESAWIELANGFMRVAQRAIPEMDLSTWKTADGSGVSIKDRASMETVAKLLGLMQTDPMLMECFRTVGPNGSTNPIWSDFENQGRVKTGTREDTTTMAGFIEFPNHPRMRIALYWNELDSKRDQRHAHIAEFARAFRANLDAGSISNKEPMLEEIIVLQPNLEVLN